MPYSAMPIYWKWLYWASPFQVRSTPLQLALGLTPSIAVVRAWTPWSPAARLAGALQSLGARLLPPGPRPQVRSFLTPPEVFRRLKLHSCDAYLSEYLSNNPGYLIDPASRAVCDFCKSSSGDDYLKQLNISFDDRWVGMGVFAAYTCTNVLLVYLFTYFPPRMPSWGPSRSRVRVEQVAAEAMAKESAEAGEVTLVEGATDAFH